MSNPLSLSVSSSIDFKDVSRQLESFQHVDSTRQQLLERLVQRVSELDAALQAAKSDLEDQTLIRRQWKTRAEVAEASLLHNQFVLALIDGNRYTFGDLYLKNTESGGADAARDLVAQLRSYIQTRSLHDNPNKVVLMVHIFADKTALSQALVDSGTISEPRNLDGFIAEFMNSQPFLYFMDCGSSEGAVDTKIKESYEFHFDNAHCKHLLLALRHESGYITELDTYGEDESTLARTSLMRSSHSTDSKFASAFHVANTPALRTTALISLEHPNGNAGEENGESSSSVDRTRISTKNHELHGLFEVEDQDSPVTERHGANQPSATDSSAPERDSSTTSTNPAISRNGGPTTELPRQIQSPVLTQEAKPSANFTTPHPTPAPNSNTAPYLGSVHSYMHDWESAPSLDIYTPPPDRRPWGSEDIPADEGAAHTKDYGNGTEKPPSRTASREATVKNPDTSQRSYGGKPDHQHHGKGAASCSICRPAKQTSKHRPALQSSPRHAPEPTPEGNQVTSKTLLQSKYSSPSNTTSAPTSPSIATVPVNQQGQRLDLPLPRPGADAHARYDARWRTKKLCNEYHLCGECRNQEDCIFDHNAIDEGVRLALRLAARQIPCKNGPRCRRQDCPNGHHCPYRTNSGNCTNKQCLFRAKGMHNVDDLTTVRFVQGQ